MAQHFFIKKGSTLPVLTMQVVNDGRMDYKKLHQKLENSAITFSMRDAKTGVVRVSSKEGLLIPVDKEVCEDRDEYYIGYKFSAKETSKPGCFIGEFNIVFLDDGSILNVPIREELYVNIGDGFSKSEIVCN